MKGTMRARQSKNIWTWALVAAALTWTGCDDDGGVDGADAGQSGAGDGASGAGGGGTDGPFVGAGGGMSGMPDAGPAASCVSDEGCPPGARCDVNAGICRTACRNDFECGTSARCAADRYCLPLPVCRSDSPCADGSICNCHGVCEPLAGSLCTTDLQCPTSEYCDDCGGACRPRVPPCGRCGMSSSACERRGDVCLPVGTAGLSHCLRGCVGDGNCQILGPGFECREIEPGVQVCVPRGDCSAPGDCVSDSDCSDGTFCNAQLYCQPGCTADVECPNDEICENLRCKVPCAVDGDCDPAGECQPSGHCRVPGGCVTSADCPQPETYCDVMQQQCVAGCERDNDCLDATRECVGGNCRPRGCAGNYQCAFGEVCDLDTAQCVAAEGRHCEPGCDPMDEASCGGPPARCLSLQDEEGNEIGDFCLEGCEPSPNECPQGYQCIELQDEEGNVVERLCARRCDREPL